MAILDGLKQLLGGATTAIQNVKRAEGSIRERLDELAREESALLSAPLAPAAVVENLRAWIEDVGRRWWAANAMDMIRGASGRIERSSGPADRIVSPNLDDMLPGVVNRDMLCALVPDVVLEGFRRGLQETTYEAGPAMAARLGRLAEIETERETLRERHAALVDEAEAAGVHLTHLPEVLGARFNKQRRREAWEADLRVNADYYSRVPTARPPEPA